MCIWSVCAYIYGCINNLLYALAEEISSNCASYIPTWLRWLVECPLLQGCKHCGQHMQALVQLRHCSYKQRDDRHRRQLVHRNTRAESITRGTTEYDPWSICDVHCGHQTNCNGVGCCCADTKPDLCSRRSCTVGRSSDIQVDAINCRYSLHLQHTASTSFCYNYGYSF